MDYQTISYKAFGIEQSLAIFKNGEVIECHTFFSPITNHNHSFKDQLAHLLSAWNEWRQKEPDIQPVFLRFFLSDIANQEDLIMPSDFAPCAYSFVQQPPLASNTKIALWCYAQKGSIVRADESFYTTQHNQYTHYWLGNQSIANKDSYHQTIQLLNDFSTKLSNRGMSIANNCVRTWFFVQNVDVNYHGVVVGRKEMFEQIGLIPSTHYIASTGIEGRCANPAAHVLMDAYAINGLKEGQQQYLYAKENMNPTYEYGVTFERGVKVQYGDRNHIYISGTASINNKGEVVFVGDIEKQTHRMLDNIEALLKEAEATFQDVCMMVVYLRDMADYQTVKEVFTKRGLSDNPKVFVLAPVCRPTWLVETECIAISKAENKKYANF